MCAVHYWVTEWHAVQKSSQSEHVVMNSILTSPMVLSPAARLTHLIIKLHWHIRHAMISVSTHYKCHEYHHWILACMLIFQVQCLSLNQYYLEFDCVWHHYFCPGLMLWIFLDLWDFFWNCFIFWFFLLLALKTCFPNMYLMFDSIWHCHSVRFWIAQARCIFLVLVTCYMSHVRICIYLVIVWSLCGVPGVYVESM